MPEDADERRESRARRGPAYLGTMRAAQEAIARPHLQALEAMQASIARPHLQALEAMQASIARPHLQALEAMQASIARPHLQALEAMQASIARPHLQALEAMQASIARPHLEALDAIQNSIPRAHLDQTVTNAMKVLSGSFGPGPGSSAFASVSKAFAEAGPGAMSSVWAELGTPDQPTLTDTVSRTRRAEPSLSPDAARALVLAWLWIMVFLVLFTVAVENYDQAKEIEAISGVTPFGVANSLVPLAAAYWVVSRKND